MTGTELSIPPQMVPPLNAVVAILGEQRTESYLVGGVVRDILLGRTTADIDIAVAGDVVDTASRVAERLGGKCVVIDEINRVARVLKTIDDSRWQFDFSVLQGTIEQDLARRDFTVDALAVDLSELMTDSAHARVIDPFGGAEDLRRRVIRVVSEGVFESDPVRLLRAARLAAELAFAIDSHTESLIRHSAQLAGGVPGERTREELLRLLAVPDGRVLGYLDELGLLTALVPELADAKGVTQPPEHFRDVFRHTLETVTAVDYLLRRGTWEYGSDDVLDIVPWSDALEEHFNEVVSSGSTRRLMLKVAALFHDVAKPATKALMPDGRTRFLGHPEQGADIAAGRMERLRFSARETRLVEVMVRYHLRPTQMSNTGLPSARAIYRFFRDTGDAGVDILFLSLADHLATRGPRLDRAGWREHVETVRHVLAERGKPQGPVTPPRLIDGHDLMNIFGLSPGPMIGEMLEAVREAQAAGDVTSREEALSYIRNRLVKN